MTPLQVFDYLAVRLDGSAAVAFGNHHLIWSLEDTGDVVELELSNGTLHSREPGAPRNVKVSATVRCTRADLNRLVVAEIAFADSIANGTVKVEGSTDLVTNLWNALTTFKMFFPIIEP